jgi:hypothetical protein
MITRFLNISPESSPAGSVPAAEETAAGFYPACRDF